MYNFLFELKEGLIISLKAIKANKMRSALTTLGIIIGIWAVVTMSTALKGIDNAFKKGVSTFGSDNIYIDKWAWFDNDIPWWELRNRRKLSIDEFHQYQALAKLPTATAPSVMTNQIVKYETRTIESVFITGTTNDYIKTTNLSIADGRFFNELESNSGRAVCVMGSDIATKLFPRGNPVDKELTIRGKKYKIVGVLDVQGSWLMGSFNPDEQVYIPIENLFGNFANKSFRTVTFNVRAANSLMVESVKDEAISIMRKVRGLKYYQANDFSINQQDALLSQINKTVGVIQIGGFFITGLALFVGAIGIMNIMFVSVKERTKEIGVRKAIGAKRRAILGQFLAESSVICLLGGLIGLGLAIPTALILDHYLPTSIQIEAVIMAIGISLLAGLIAGFAPAYTAAQMDPVEALRYE